MYVMATRCKVSMRGSNSDFKLTEMGEGMHEFVINLTRVALLPNMHVAHVHACLQL